MAKRKLSDSSKAFRAPLDHLPPTANGRRSVSHLYPGMCRDIQRKFSLEAIVTTDNYGQGFASFIDAWFYKDTPDFRIPRLNSAGHDFVGLWVLLSHAAPYYVMGQGSKGWSAKTASSYMPSFDGVDAFPSPAVKHLAHRIDTYLASQSLVRLHKNDLAGPLPAGYEVQSNLIDGQARLFDALFFWFD